MSEKPLVFALLDIVVCNNSLFNLTEDIEGDSESEEDEDKKSSGRTCEYRLLVMLRKTRYRPQEISFLLSAELNCETILNSKINRTTGKCYSVAFI